MRAWTRRFVSRVNQGRPRLQRAGWAGIALVVGMVMFGGTGDPTAAHAQTLPDRIRVFITINRGAGANYYTSEHMTVCVRVERELNIDTVVEVTRVIRPGSVATFELDLEAGTTSATMGSLSEVAPRRESAGRPRAAADAEGALPLRRGSV